MNNFEKDGIHYTVVKKSGFKTKYPMVLFLAKREENGSFIYSVWHQTDGEAIMINDDLMPTRTSADEYALEMFSKFCGTWEVKINNNKPFFWEHVYSFVPEKYNLTFTVAVYPEEMVNIYSLWVEQPGGPALLHKEAFDKKEPEEEVIEKMKNHVK